MSFLKKIPTRKEVVAKAKADGTKIVAVLPFHYPRAMFRAYGLHPMEVWGPPHANTTEADRHFQAYTCAIVRKASAYILQGALDMAEAILIPHTCDALQGMGSVFNDFLKPHQKLLTLYHPRQLRESDRLFMIDELKRLALSLEEISGKQPSEAEWRAALDIEEKGDAALAALYENRENIALTDREFYTLVRAREFMPIEAWTALANEAPNGPNKSTGVPLMISGIVVEPMSLFDAFNESGGRVALDDLACGYRRVYPQANDKDPIARLADTLLGAPPDPTKGAPIADRVSALLARLKKADAKGVVIFGAKFCEPELFDLPLVRKHLQDAGYAVTHVETEMGEELPQQAVTRIEAFVETLQC